MLPRHLPRVFACVTRSNIGICVGECVNAETTSCGFDCTCHTPTPSNVLEWQVRSQCLMHLRMNLRVGEGVYKRRNIDQRMRVRMRCCGQKRITQATQSNLGSAGSVIKHGDEELCQCFWISVHVQGRSHLSPEQGVCVCDDQTCFTQT